MALGPSLKVGLMRAKKTELSICFETVSKKRNRFLDRFATIYGYHSVGRAPHWKLSVQAADVSIGPGSISSIEMKQTLHGGERRFAAFYANCFTHSGFSYCLRWLSYINQNKLKP